MEQLDTMVRSLEEKFEALSANVELYQVPTFAITEGLEKIGKGKICKMSPNNSMLHDLVQDCCTLMDRVENALTAIVHQETGYAESFLGGDGAGGSECNKSSSPSTSGFLLESSQEWTDTSSMPNTSQTSGSQNSSQSYVVSCRWLEAEGARAIGLTLDKVLEQIAGPVLGWNDAGRQLRRFSKPRGWLCLRALA